MSVEILATRRHGRRRSDLPCRESADAVPWAVTIRVGDRTFTSDCRDQQEAIEVAPRISAELARHYEEQRGRG